MTHPGKPTTRQLLTSITEAKPRCFYEPDDYMDDNTSKEWATYICQDCPVLRQCRDYADAVERWTGHDAYLGAIYGGETPTQRSQRRNATLKSQYADDRRSA